LSPGKGEYKGALDVLAKVVKSEGFFALWKGFTPYYFRYIHVHFFVQA
jgi:solute carrier family 25 oxoglutarate transporter 11